MSARATVRAEPSTPSPIKQPHLAPPGVPRVDAIISDLNADCNLAIDTCDKSLTPSHRRERAKVDYQFARCDKISQILQHLYSKGGEGLLDTTLTHFRRESRAACRKWIYKPRADHDTLPSSSAPYKASTPGEQDELQEILVLILEQMREGLRSQPPDRPATRSRAASRGRDESTDSFAIPSRPSQPPRPKRPSNEGLESSPNKRLKERQLERDRVATAIDQVFARKKVGLDDPPSIFRQSSKPLNRSLYDDSANTSKASLVPSIFSDLAPLPASQSTVDPDTQEPNKRLRADFAPHPSTADSFAPSSGDIRALDESFSHFDEPGPEPESPLIKRHHEMGTGGQPVSSPWVTHREPPKTAPLELFTSPAHSTEYSDFSELLDVHIPEILAPPQSTALEDRLRNIWRRFIMLTSIFDYLLICH